MYSRQDVVISFHPFPSLARASSVLHKSYPVVKFLSTRISTGLCKWQAPLMYMYREHRSAGNDGVFCTK